MATFSEIQDAFFFVNSDEYGMNTGVYCRAGTIFRIEERKRSSVSGARMRR